MLISLDFFSNAVKMAPIINELDGLMNSPDDTTLIISASASHVRSATGLSIRFMASFVMHRGPVADRKSEADQMAIVSIPISTTLPTSSG